MYVHIISTTTIVSFSCISIAVAIQSMNQTAHMVQFQPKDDPESDTSEGPTCLIIIIHIYDYSQLLFISIYK